MIRATSLRPLDELPDESRLDPADPPPESPEAPGAERSEWGVWTIQLHPGLHRQRSRVFARDRREAHATVAANLHRRAGKWIIDPFQVPDPW